MQIAAGQGQIGRLEPWMPPFRPGLGQKGPPALGITELAGDATLFTVLVAAQSMQAAKAW